ncbi:hypothetical protein CDAR_60371 [Caerostris darwini]|uniref:Uncharacterized protein n=1 Tax=Caerostris darwini TaxID=1538125 RepID=A0AAV4QKD4_9ARAC|nr:hypothetical protein CDAR_60371 [Caerostris darwini]
MLAEDRRNAFYVRIVIFAHKTTLSEDGCKRCLLLRQLSSEYKFRGEEEEERVGHKRSDVLFFCPRLCHSHSTKSSDDEANAGAALWRAKSHLRVLISEMEAWIPYLKDRSPSYLSPCVYL